MATLALLLALGQAPAWAATIQVGVGCTLVEAITAANSNFPVGGCAAGSGAEDTIMLPPGSTHTLISPVADNSLGYSGLPIITSPITIEGNGSTVRRDTSAPDDFRVFTVGRLGELTLRNTTVSGGKLQQFSGLPDTRYFGGGLLSDEGIVVLTNSTVTGNIAALGGGIASEGGVLLITNSTVSSNTAYRAVGGVLSDSTFASDAHLRIDNSTISGNYTRGSGGGLLAIGGTPIIITNSRITLRTTPALPAAENDRRTIHSEHHHHHQQHHRGQYRRGSRLSRRTGRRRGVQLALGHPDTHQHDRLGERVIGKRSIGLRRRDQ